MTKLELVPIGTSPVQRWAPLVDAARLAELTLAAAECRTFLTGRTIWNVNSTATGGGVAEMLTGMLPYARGIGLDVRWAVIEGDAEFFAITKRLHNNIHGMEGDGGPLGPAEAAHYREVVTANADELIAMTRPGDIVFLHDPQPLGMAAIMKSAGATVIWRCHIGSDDYGALVQRGWEFLRPHIGVCDAFIFSRESYAPPWLDRSRLVIVPPSIDPFTPKNQDLDPATVVAILHHIGVVDGPEPDVLPLFTRSDGTPGRVDHHADILRAGRAPDPSDPLVVQISRWDTLKDMSGVMHGFAAEVDGRGSAHLVLAGPSVKGVADDPEGAAELDRCMREWRELPHAARERIQLVCLPMRDAEENAAMVNALQRHAAIVVQKSLMEGFGLTVAEAMWKSRPVIASAVGGINDQIIDGQSGVLVDDPSDLAAFGAALGRLLADGAERDRLGKNAHQRVHDQFLIDGHLLRYVQLLRNLED